MVPNDGPTEIGVCPRCRTDLMAVDVLIEYETSEGDRAVWADCPGCGTVVDPDSDPDPSLDPDPTPQ